MAVMIALAPVPAKFGSLVGGIMGKKMKAVRPGPTIFVPNIDDWNVTDRRQSPDSHRRSVLEQLLSLTLLTALLDSNERPQDD